ncbi:MAG: BAX inhibitor (BI)-1/YccA family protein, partial [Gallionella sp.]
MEQEYIPATQIGAVATAQNRVLRNTYMMLALTMIPTVIGAFIGMSTNFSFMAQHPVVFSLLMLGSMIGLMFAVGALRN